MLQEELPCSVAQELDSRGLNGVPVLLSTSADLSLEGDPGKHWLVVTRERVSVVDDGSQATVLQSVLVPEVDSFRAHSAIGSGFLQAFIHGGWVDLLRYSNSLAGRFHHIARKLEDFRKTGELNVGEEEIKDDTRCDKCGLRLPSVGEICPRCVPSKAIIIRLAYMLWPQRRAALAMFGLMLVGVLADLAPPKLQQYLVDDILQSGQGNPQQGHLVWALLVVVLTLAATRVILGFVGYWKGRLATDVGVALTSDLRSRLVEKLSSLGVAYYDRHQVGSLTSRVSHDSEVIHSLLQQITGGFLLQIVQVVGVGMMLFTLNAKLALYMLIPTPLVVGGSWFFWRRVYPKYYQYWDASSKQAGTLNGILSGIRVVKAFAQEDREYQRFRQSSERLRTSRTTVEHSTSAFSGAMQLIFSLGGLIVWYVGGRDVLAGKMTLGSLMAFLAYVSMFYAPLSTLSQLTTWLTSFLTGCHRVFELLDTPLETREATTTVPLENAAGKIEFRDVTFGYDRHHPVLKDVSFDIQPGQTIGIVGRSGSGKTTLVNLICRFYDVTDGCVLVDGVDVRQLATQELRRHVGVVLQEPFLFRGTIWDNLVYGEPNATREIAIRAAKAAQSHDFILRTPLGYDTWLGERGAGLSGGERQRLSIARALLYDPKILILDEATSSVDTESEKAIQEALRALARGRTTIAIAHRLTTLRDAHRILVFDQGKLLEQGSHAELMRLDGQYAKLVKIQTQLSSNASVDLVATKEKELPEILAARESQPTAESPSTGLAEYEPRWLEPGTAVLERDERGTLRVQVASNDTTHVGVFAVQLFPASDPHGFVSLRVWDVDGHEQEIGIVRQLAAWSTSDQALLRDALGRRYFVHTVTEIESIQQEFGYLTVNVRTSRGPIKFMMRWTQAQVQDFGKTGKVLVDLEENRYLVPDVAGLPTRQRDLFQQYIYW